MVIIVLLPKEGGGHKPIGLFPSIIRIWMRARALTAREWEELTASPDLFGATGMGAQRAAWAAAFSAESAAVQGQEHAAAPLDLVKAFEKIPRRQLVQAVREHGFNLIVLRLSLAAYKFARTIGVDGVFSEPVVANRGITVFSGFATTELRVLLTDLMFSLKKVWNVELKLYVDDLTIAASGRPKTVIDTVAAATNDAVDYFQRLGLQVSARKSLAVASRPTIRKRLAKKWPTKR